MQMKIFIHHMVAKCNNNSNGTKIKNTMRIYYQCQCNNGILQPEPRKVKEFAHEFRAATLECNAGLCAVELPLTLFHNH